MLATPLYGPLRAGFHCSLAKGRLWFCDTRHSRLIAGLRPLSAYDVGTLSVARHPVTRQCDGACLTMRCHWPASLELCNDSKNAWSSQNKNSKNGGSSAALLPFHTEMHVVVLGPPRRSGTESSAPNRENGEQDTLRRHAYGNRSATVREEKSRGATAEPTRQGEALKCLRGLQLRYSNLRGG